MLTPVFCNGCGGRLEVPAGYSKSKMRCPECGVFTELPEAVRAEAQAAPARPTRPAAKSVAPRPAAKTKSDSSDDDAYVFLSDEELAAAANPAAPPADDVPLSAEVHEDPEREVLIHGTEEDDFNPYTVTGDAPSKRCPECAKKIDRAAKVCPHCGYNEETKEKVKRTFQPVHREWETGLPHDRRVTLFIGMQVVNFIILVTSLIGGYGVLSFTLVLMMVGLQAFLCGTYSKLTLDRTARGKVTLTTTWRYLFMPQLPKPIRWKEHDAVTIVRSNDFDMMDWCAALILFSYCVLPGALFWWFVIRPDKFAVTLCKDHGFPETPIFRTTNEDRAKEVMDTVCDITTLPVQK